jgi:hypothetical protein
MAHDQDPELEAEAKQQETVLLVGMLRVVVENCIFIKKRTLRILE